MPSSMKKRAAFILILSLLPSLGYAERQLLDRVVAVVDEDAITQSELDNYMRPLYEQLKQEHEGDHLVRKLHEVRTKLLNQMIEDRLVYHEAKEMGIEVTEADIEEELQEFKNQFTDETSMDQALQEQGLSMTALKDRLKRSLMVRRLHDIEIRSKIVVSPRELEKYYSDHQEEFMETDQVKARFMTIKKSAQSRDKGLTDEPSLARIRILHERVLRGEDFAKLATENSEDSYAAGGGVGDWLKPGSMIPALEEVLFKLEPGAVSGVIETPMGYHFFRVEAKKEGRNRTFEEAREEILEKIFQEKARARFEEWMEELKRKSYISVR